MPLRTKISFGLIAALILVATGALLVRCTHTHFDVLLSRKTEPKTLQGEVTYVDRESSTLFLQNATDAYRVDTQRMPEGLKRGDNVEVYGSFDSDTAAHQFHAIDMEFIDKAPKIRPEPIAANAIGHERLRNKLVQFSAIVHSVSFDFSEQMLLRVKVGGSDVKVQIQDPLGLASDALPDATLRFQGVMDEEYDSSGVLLRTYVRLQRANQAHIEKEAAPLDELPVQTVQSLQSLSSAQMDHRVRVRGAVKRSESGELRLIDSTGSIRLDSVAYGEAESSEYDAWGFVENLNGMPVLQDAISVERTEANLSNVAQPSSGVHLTHVSQVHELPDAQARHRYPVALRGVVTFVYKRQNGIFLQDKTGGIYVVVGPDAPRDLAVGQLLEVKGFTAPGDYAPIVDDGTIRHLGTANLPKPASASVTDLLSGREDSRWVEMEGIIHEVNARGAQAYALAEMAGNTFRISVPEKSDLPLTLVDAKVRLRGVCATIFNSRRQILGVRVFVPGKQFITVLQPQTPLEQIPLESVASLGRFSLKSQPGHRHRVRGVVLKGDHSGLIYLNDNTGTFRVESPRGTRAVQGDLVDAVGFLRGDGLGQILTEASLNVLKQGVPTVPMDVSAAEVKEEAYEGQLVRLKAVLMDRVIGQGNETLILRANHNVFQARLEGATSTNAAKNSLLQLTGICDLQIHSGRSNKTSDFALLLRSPSDVVVLKSAPWWNSEAFGWWLMGIGGLALMVSGWAVLLRRQVIRQTRVIREQLLEAQQLGVAAQAASRAKGEFLANMSHEIRTPLNGVLGMTELALMEPLTQDVRDYLETARTSGLGLLQVINDVLDLSKIEAGQMTIETAPFDLKELVTNSLALFLPAASQKSIKAHMVYPNDCPDRFLGDAVRIRQVVLNLLGNAMKFTERGEVELLVQCKPANEGTSLLRIQVRDTGIGISAEKLQHLFQSFQQADSSTTRRYGGTGLGLSISKQLVELMGGVISCTSAPGQGSIFSFELPLQPFVPAPGEAPVLRELFEPLAPLPSLR